MKQLPLSFFVLTPAWMAYTYALAEFGMRHSLWVFLLALLPVALPLALAGWYSATVRRIRRAQLFSQQGPLFSLITGRFLAYSGWTFWALGSAALMTLYLGTASAVEGFAIALSAPFFAMLYVWGRRHAARELRPFVASHFATRWARWITAAVMTCLLILLAYFAPAISSSASFDVAVAQQRAAMPVGNSSVLMAVLADWVATVAALREFIAMRASQSYEWAYLPLLIASYFALLFNIGLALAAFALPTVEYRRLLNVPTDTGEPAPAEPMRIALVAGLTTFLLVCLYLPGAAYLEAWLRSDTPLPNRVLSAGQTVVQQVDVIDGRYYHAGTVRGVRQLRRSLMADLDLSEQRLQQLSGAAHDGMQQNVDAYLDWYYSLPAEYLRIGALLTGNIEELMARKLTEFLSRGETMQLLEKQVAGVVLQRDQLLESYQQELDSLLSTSEVIPGAAQIVQVNETLPFETHLLPPGHAALVGLEGRAIASGGAALLGSVVAGKVVAKVIGKGTLKLGAKALVKVASGKALGGAGGAAGGAAIGAAVGSVVPGVGTVVGAAIGGALGGIVVGVSVEALLLMLEEAFARQDFEADLRAAIEESRREMLLKPAF